MISKNNLNANSMFHIWEAHQCIQWNENPLTYVEKDEGAREGTHRGPLGFSVWLFFKAPGDVEKAPESFKVILLLSEASHGLVSAVGLL